MNTKVALLSVSDKDGVVDLARFLVQNGYSVVSTMNTCALLRQASLPVLEISQYTGHPEIMDGRVKTLHPKIFAGILSNRSTHTREVESLGIDAIDLVVVNLYPFVKCLKKGSSSEAELVEHIDVGGVSLLRAAAKNFQHVTVISSTQDYGALICELTENNGVTSPEFRKRMAAKAFAVTSAYDAHVYGWLSTDLDMLPEEIVLCGTKVHDLRIGENPHQKAAIYGMGTEALPIERLHGKQLSYNNIVDIEASIKIVSDFDMPAASVIKHGNPCGAAISSAGIEDAYHKAISCDPLSSFGGIIALNRTVTMEIANALKDIFVESIVAPDFDQEVLTALSSKKNLRIVKYTPCYGGKFVFKSVLRNGMLLQERDNSAVGLEDMTLVTKTYATQESLEDLLFAWRVCKHVRSNAIVIARQGRAIGVGAGQMSRVDSVEIAIKKAGDCAGAVMASDAFFPFADGIQCAADAGIVAIVQPGGSIRDDEVKEAANNSHISMYFTGTRSFCH
ncbi:bifunctional purine biosynthesis protein PurH [Anaplasma platys]|uniref:Bifunctional purine biosynthesis protein PurH n=1 Tax=Anaplasma platys TaxID=949 RepID=A0A858PZ25_9RICK|nr:bifunctional phosphoribosylaminoimidazolecarboxamide formyltransferase/IMP cyclohydrolase [Anaplasma platys]QJC27866.1 bifunctional purine biosynthesis protein PurH [Anaplasma platys]